MATVAVNRPILSPSTTTAAPVRSIATATALAVALGLILILNLPAFVCMPLDADACHWDLFARTVSQGGVAYRDLLENNFPGMLWAHLAVRSVFGWRSETLRVADAIVVASIIVLLIRWLPAGTALAWRLFAAIVLASFYLITSEWCHCQRDVWMLLPALLALGVRRRQLDLLSEQTPANLAVLRSGGAEGLLWGAAFWIKPYVAVPCVVCWLTGTSNLFRMHRARPRWLLIDAASVLAGGLLAGAAGIAWLAASGALADFADVIFVWDREYVHFNMGRNIGWIYYIGPLVRLAPWPLVHLAAVPLACLALWRRESLHRSLLSAFYLGWFGQALVLQHIYDYIHVPALMLAIAVLCQQIVADTPGLARTLVLALLLLGVGTRLPAATVHRLGCWNECLHEGSSIAVRDKLSSLSRMSWGELDQVRAFLQKRGVHDCELTCLTNRTIPLFEMLGVRPSSRYVFLENILLVFTRQRQRMYADLAAGRQRYVVCDVTVTGWRSAAEAPASDTAEPASRFDHFPHKGLLFRTGRYAVFELSSTEMPDWIRANLDI